MLLFYVLLLVFIIVAFYTLYEFFSVFVASRRRYLQFDTNDNEKAVNWLVEDLENAKTALKIVGGLAVIEVYNNPAVKKALINAIKRGVWIQAMFGPALDGRDKHILVQLAEEKKIDLYKLPTIAPVHFRLGDDSRVFMEQPHSLLQEHREIIRPEDGSASVLASHLARQFEVLKRYAKRAHAPRKDFEAADVTKNQVEMLRQCMV